MKKIFVLLVSGCSFFAIAASPSIGFIKSNGTFRVDGSTIRGNSTLVEGDLVETTDARSTVQIGSIQIALLPDSRAKLYNGRAVFEKGSGVASSADKYVIEALGLRVAPATQDSVVQVDLRGATDVAVTARSGAASVYNHAGVLLASLHPGEALDFEPQAGAAAAMKITGVLERKGTQFLLSDETTHLAEELRGLDLANYLGLRVEIEGSIIPGVTPAPGASHVVSVVSVKALPPVSARVKGGISGPAVGGIVGGVAIVGTVAGLAASGTFSGSEAPASAK
jgi:hypothetical protein